MAPSVQLLTDFILGFDQRVMELSIKEVEHVARLARLALTEEEKCLYAQQLGRIIANFRHLQAIDTEGVEPMAHALPLTNVMRQDVVLPGPEREILLAGAPAREGNFFQVPRIGE